MSPHELIHIGERLDELRGEELEEELRIDALRSHAQEKMRKRHGVLRLEENVEELHGGDRHVVAVVVDATQERGEQQRLTRLLAADEGGDEVDERRRRRAQQLREDQSQDSRAGDDARVAATETRLHLLLNAHQLHLEVPLQNDLQHLLEQRLAQHEGALRVVFAVRRTLAQHEQLREEGESLEQKLVWLLQPSRVGRGAELDDHVEEVLREQFHDRSVVGEVERDVGERKGCEEENCLPRRATKGR